MSLCRSPWLVCSALCLGLSSAAAAAEPSAKGVEFFEKKIRPVLIEQCYKCHSSETDKPKGGLLLDSAAGMLRGGENGPALVPGEPGKSLLVQTIRHEGLEMPPEKKLPAQAVADIAEWIKMGAPDPRTGGAVAAKREIDIEEGRKFWAFQPPAKAALPKLKAKTWPRRELDNYVLSTLESKGLKPVADADRRVIARRLYFDLIGLPPTPEEMAQFENDRSHQALENLVDRLLESPRFGERWGRHWLDVARYAESNGNADNIVFGHAWRYRDYVIASLNADKPFDRFITEQIAGDLLPTDSPRERDSLLVATGFLAMGSKPRAQNNPDFQMDVVAEQLEVVTTGLMALTVACARCHDHKFDPIPTSEYYAMAGIFTSTATLYGPAGRGNDKKNNGGVTGLHILAGADADAEIRKEQEQKLAVANRQRSKLVDELKEMGAEIASAEPVKGKKPVKPKKANKKQPAETESEAEVKVPKDASSEDAEKIRELAAQMKQADSEIKKLEATLVPTALAMGARDGKAADCKICLRGDSRKLGDSVPRGVVSVATVGEPVKIEAKSSGRLELAAWIASRDNPLTARVIVNRIWRQLMGRGIVSTVDNFGVLGEKPSHPELLDYLAVKFVDDGWSIKRMIREITLSHTYALSSDHHDKSYEQDPDNVLLWRHSPHRLDAESVRDAILHVSGKLALDPLEGSVVASFAGQDLRNAKLNLAQAIDAKGSHRSVYLPVIRNKMPEALDLFDVADPSLVVGSRDTTTVPSQSLYLMNSPTVVQQSAHFATRLLEVQDLSDAGRIDAAFRRALARAATKDEITLGESLVAKAKAAFAENQKSESKVEHLAWSALCQALYASAEFRYVE